MPIKSYDMGPTALRALESKSCYVFLSLLKYIALLRVWTHNL
jgi:hypothetical protein